MLSRLNYDRAPAAALALTTDSSVLTAIGNDYGYERVFERQVLGLGRPGDVLIAISTSGRSLAVVAVKVVHPGESGQAVGCDTHRHDRRIARMNIHKNARLTPPEPALAKAGVDCCWCSGLRVAAGGSRRPP